MTQSMIYSQIMSVQDSTLQDVTLNEGKKAIQRDT